MSAMTPGEIVAALDRYIIGQADAKRAVVIAIRNRWRRQRLTEPMRGEVGPKNILMAGPTGVGKTEIARRLATLVNAPFLKIEATKYTEVGYHGRDVDTIIRDLHEIAMSMVRSEQTEVVRQKADELVEERLVDLLLPADAAAGADAPDDGAAAKRVRVRDKLREQLRSGQLDDRLVEMRVESRVVPIGMVAGNMAVDQMEPEMQDFLEKLVPGQSRERRITIKEARKVIFQQECDRLIDRDKVEELATERTENNGIVFLDEIDKLCGGQTGHGPDVSRQGVQRDLLPLIEGCSVRTRHGVVRTDHILFIAAGAFHSAKPSDLMPELQGRLPIRVELSDLTRADFIRILTEPDNALTKQAVAMMATEGVRLCITTDGIEAMADIAAEVNRSTENIGARRLHTIVEKVLEDLSYIASDKAGETITIDADYVRARLNDIVKDQDLSKFIL